MTISSIFYINQLYFKEYKMFNYLLLLSFLTNAQAVFYIEDIPASSHSIASTNVNKRYEIKTRSSGQSPRLQIKEESLENGKFLASGITFEEQCILAQSAPSCVYLSTPMLYPSDSQVPAVYSRGPLHISHPQRVKFDNVCLISNGDVMIESDKIQMSGFVKTPGTLTFQSHSLLGTIKRFVFSPYKFSFKSKSGFDMPSSTLFISTDIDFVRGFFNIQYQCADSVAIFEDKVNFDTAQDLSFPKKRSRDQIEK